MLTFGALHSQSMSRNELNDDCIKPYDLITQCLRSFMAKLHAPEKKVYAETLAPITLVDAALF